MTEEAYAELIASASPDALLITSQLDRLADGLFWVIIILFIGIFAWSK